MRIKYGIIILLITMLGDLSGQQRARDYEIEVGVLKPGLKNSITDIHGVAVGHRTLIQGDSIRTGVTAIIPHQDNIFQEKVPAAIYLGNGFGKLAGISQVMELGNIESPIILTNTLSVATGIQGGLSYVLGLPGNENVRSANIVVGETNDGRLNDIRGRHVKEADVLMAIEQADTLQVEEGNVGAGTGTICFGWKGGIGSSSRKLPASMGGYSVGVLVQSNFGGVLTIDGVPVGKEMGKYPYRTQIEQDSDGSCMIVVATDAPVSPRNLERMAKRAMLGLARTGGIASNGSGDYVIAFSTYKDNRVPYQLKKPVSSVADLHNDRMTPLFLATIEATEEAILNSLFAARDMKGFQGSKVDQLPIIDVLKMMKKYGKNVSTFD